jgi:hypothetical protein
MDWVKVTVKLGRMRGTHLVQAEQHTDPYYQQEHRQRAMMADVLQEALMAGLTEEDRTRFEDLDNAD